MSSVDVLKKKNLSVVWGEKKSKCPKKNFQSVKRGGGGYLSMEFRVFEKKGIRRKILKEKKSKCFLWRKKKKN